MVLERGIDVNPSKFKALVDTRKSATIKDVQQLFGKITALSRFTSRYGDKCRPMSKYLFKQGVKPRKIREKREKDGKNVEQAKFI